MKATKYITLALLLATSTIGMAGEISTGRNSNETEINPVNELYRLAPVTPAEATFDDEMSIYLPISLLPYTPEFADFDDYSPEPASSVDSKQLAPVMPSEATFEEDFSSDDYSAEFLKSIAPSVPEEATFED